MWRLNRINDILYFIHILLSVFLLFSLAINAYRMEKILRSLHLKRRIFLDQFNKCFCDIRIKLRTFSFF